MKPGSMVKVVEYGGEVVERTIVSRENGVTYVCRPDEWAAARREGREPVSVGFLSDDVVQPDVIGAKAPNRP